ncbi:MAG TPA: hypothetical protein VFX16_33610 [Pseudonocardiaceae bacterium]|nr:hypothetical protein [Pseudonocardiaceae bacterium]
MRQCDDEPVRVLTSMTSMTSMPGLLTDDMFARNSCGTSFAGFSVPWLPVLPGRLVYTSCTAPALLVNSISVARCAGST